MSTDAFHRRGPSAMNPPASLTSVRVKRRASLVPPSGKPGDLTDGGDASETPETETMSAPEAPAITQAAMDAHHEARVAEAAAVARPAEPAYEAPPAEPADDAAQPIIVLPPPVLNGEHREWILPMTELLPEVAAEMHEQIRTHELYPEHEASQAQAPAPESIAHSYQPELLVTSPLPHEPEIATEPEVTFEPESATQARFIAESWTLHEPGIIAEPEIMAELEIIAEPEIVAPPQAMAEPMFRAELEITAEPMFGAEPEITTEPMFGAEPEITAEPMFGAEPEIMAEPKFRAEPEIMAEPKTAVEPAVMAEPDERQEPRLTTPSPEPSNTVIQLPLAAAEPAPATPAAPEEARAPDILDYWDTLRGARDYPVVDEVDRARVAGSWPNTVLLSFKTEIPQITRIGENDGEIEYTAMVTSWLMTRGRHAVKRGEPMEEEQKFPLSNGSARYRLLVLPMLGKGSQTCDHALCQITRAEERSAVASFKRWLAG
jgi:hypothetical protein